MKDLMGLEKPSFLEGDRVEFDVDGAVKGKGVIRGQSTVGLIDFWIVELTERSAPMMFYAYSCATIPHTALKRIP